VRADFYDTGERVYFGELTFTPMAGFNTNLTPEAQYILGSLIELPEPLLNI